MSLRLIPGETIMSWKLYTEKRERLITLNVLGTAYFPLLWQQNSLPSLKPWRAGCRSVYYGINNTRPGTREETHIVRKSPLTLGYSNLKTWKLIRNVWIAGHSVRMSIQAIENVLRVCITWYKQERVGRIRDRFNNSLKISEFRRSCGMENHWSVTGWQELFLSYKSF